MKTGRLLPVFTPFSCNFLWIVTFLFSEMLATYKTIEEYRIGK